VDGLPVTPRGRRTAHKPGISPQQSGGNSPVS